MVGVAGSPKLGFYGTDFGLGRPIKSEVLSIDDTGAISLSESKDSEEDIELGMGSALETLCGQAFGAGQIDMLGVYMQRSWVILNITTFILTFFYIFAGPFLRLIARSTAEISKAAGTFAVWMIPQIYAYALNFPNRKVFTGAEQDDSDVSDFGGGTGFAHFLQLVADVEVGVGNGGCSGGAELVVVVHSGGSALVYL
ncbi:hypothetical protein F0562_033267 [Nyssa sinensis]|uniref:Uncharacterized protein n=1 Tax=Nyssa sinensis TaxID=561372 RepID=A0A5J5ARL8_9ASTE|nr:hypothetical protein F0562_033267 [Nyssa sinensis]